MFITRQHIETFLIIGLGGIIGANLRYWVSGWAAEHLGQAFPWGTLIINFTGSALLGLFLGWASTHSALDPRVKLLIATGFFGAYTTFSTYATDSIMLMRSDAWIGAVGNILGTNVLCLVGALLGTLIGLRL
jgi:CrcB protein